MKCIVFECQKNATLTSMYCDRCNYKRKRSAAYIAEQRLTEWQEKLARIKKQLQAKREAKKHERMAKQNRRPA